MSYSKSYLKGSISANLFNSIERKSRKIFLVKNKSKSSRNVQNMIMSSRSVYPVSDMRGSDQIVHRVLQNCTLQGLCSNF